MKACVGLALLAVAALAAGLPAQEAPVDFVKDILPVLEKRCFDCHGPAKSDARGTVKAARAGLRLDGRAWMLKGGNSGAVLVAGSSQKSDLHRRVALPADDPDVMPPKGGTLSAVEIAAIARWIDEGPKFGDWNGVLSDGGPTADSKPESADPVDAGRLAAERRRLLETLSEGLPPAASSAVAALRAFGATVETAMPGTALLRIHFSGSEDRVDDAGIGKLDPVAQQIAVLDLSRTAVTDAAMGAVGRLPRLVRLDLRGTRITDKGLAKLGKLGELRYLNLVGSAVGDDSIQVLQGFTKLESLYLWQTQVTEKGAAALRQALPKTRVVLAASLPSPPEPADDGGGNRRRRQKK